MSRKNVFANLTTPNPVAAEQESAPETTPEFARPLLGKSKPMSAVGKSLGELNDRSLRADEIERRLAEGQTVIELDPALIDPSFVQDRMPGEIDGLKTQIREQGQQVPILVRPHPEHEGRYQVAFGHRRHRAVLELGRMVKAIVRELSDEQLVIAQGQENNERKDLTYIEKARFADRLKARFSRETIMSALSMQKGNLSMMLSIVDRLPPELIDAIGSAPGVGRRSWNELADYLAVEGNMDKAIDLSGQPETQALPSDERFQAVFRAIKPRSANRPAEDWQTPNGHRLGQIKASKGKLEISINRTTSPEFAAFVVERLPSLFDEFRSKKSDQH